MSKYIKILTAIFVLTVPVLIWFRKHQPIHPQKIIQQLHTQFENISFISIDYTTSTRKLLGINCEVYTGVLHIRKDDATERYQFIANSFTVGIMDTTAMLIILCVQ